MMHTMGSHHRHEWWAFGRVVTRHRDDKDRVCEVTTDTDT